MDQLDLFPNVRRSDPDTSHAAAALKRVTLRSLVKTELRRHPDGLTDWELTARLGLDARRKPSVGKRRQEAGATDTGRRRPSPDGNACVVWAIETWPAESEREGLPAPTVSPPCGDLGRPTPLKAAPPWPAENEREGFGTRAHHPPGCDLGRPAPTTEGAP